MTVQTDLPAEQTLFRGVSPSTEKLILARLYGEPLETVPDGLYIPPEALRVFLESFEGPLDLLLYLIRRQKFDIMDIPMAEVCEQYMRYVEMVRENALELASAYLVMSATLMQIKSRMLLPAPPAADGTEPEDPRAELMRRLLEYEKIRNASVRLQALPRCGRDFHVASAERVVTNEVPLPEVTKTDVAGAWLAVIGRLKLSARHRVTRQELSVREHMTTVLKLLTEKRFSTSHSRRNRNHALETGIFTQRKEDTLACKHRVITNQERDANSLSMRQSVPKIPQMRGVPRANHGQLPCHARITHLPKPVSPQPPTKTSNRNERRQNSNSKLTIHHRFIL